MAGFLIAVQICFLIGSIGDREFVMRSEFAVLTHLLQIDHIKYTCADDEAELTVLPDVDRAGSHRVSTTFLMDNATQWLYFNNPR